MAVIDWLDNRREYSSKNNSYTVVRKQKLSIASLFTVICILQSDYFCIFLASFYMYM